MRTDNHSNESRATRFSPPRILTWRFSGSLETAHPEGDMEEFLYGQIPQFLRDNTTSGCKTLNSGVLRESQFRSVFGMRIAPLTATLKWPLPGEPQP